MSRYNKLQTYILKKYSKTFLEVHDVSLISQHNCHLISCVFDKELGLSEDIQSLKCKFQ